MANEVAAKKWTTDLSNWANNFTELIERDYSSNGIELSGYSKQCAMDAVTAIYNLVKVDDKVEMKSLDMSNLRGIVAKCASLKLNANASPREVYFQIRNVKVGNNWIKQVEMGIEGAGWDSILSNYGKDVKRVYPYWVVKEGDTYIPPKHKGIEVTPPEWEPMGLSEKVVRVVYPVMLTDDSVVYLSSERSSVKTNLFAHIRNNLMNETFGIAESKFKATDKEKKEINEKKETIYAALRKCETVEDMLACEEARPYISGAWIDTPESMITRKLCNNAIRKFPKNYDAMANKAMATMDEFKPEQPEDIEVESKEVQFVDEDVEVVGGDVE